MELVYLWVEEYKNIKRQGFNFSPRFRCEFKDEYVKDKDGNEVLKDDCELIIEENEDYVSIFPENINITAIVGENGSGKSGIIDLIYMIYSNYKFEAKFVICFRGYYITNIRSIMLDEKYKKLENINSIKYYYYSSYEKEKTSFSIDEYERPKEKNYTKNINNIFLIDEFFTSKKIRYLFAKRENLKVSSFLYIPCKVKISLKEESQIADMIFNNPYDIPSIFLGNDYDSFLLKLYMLNSFNGDLLDSYHYMPWLITEAKEESKKVVSYEIYKKCYKNRDFFDIKDLSDEEWKFYFVDCKNFFYFDFKDSKERTFDSLSSGEKNIYGQLLNIYYNFLINNELGITFLFDEPEITLHPNWQKKYISELIEISKVINPSAVNYIISVHSPFILSDVPKDNVVFLEKGKQVYPFENGQTFGANIHTLLSHGFFMKDGLMGEFAKSKIEIIKRFYDFTTKYKDRIFSKEKVYLRVEKYYKSNKKEFDYIFSIIGEPFLQKVIKNYLDELEEIFDKEKYKQKRLKKLVEEFGEDTLREYLK